MASRRSRSDRSRPAPGAGARRGTGAGFRPLLAAALIVAVGLAAYGHSFTGVFVLDDVPSIVRNPHIRTLWPLTRAMSAPAEATVAGRPLVSLTLALNYAVAPPASRDVLEPTGPGGDPLSAERYIENLWGYHLVNLLIHLGAGLTLFGIVRRTMAMAAPESASDDTALAAALIWTVHPLLTGSVTYIVQRAESLMGLFLLLTLYSAIRATASTRSKAWMAASIAACAAGMASKEVMIAAPLVVVAWDWVFLKRLRPAFYAGLAATWVLLFWLMWTHPRTESIGFGFAAWPWWRYLITQFGVIAHYLQLALVPSPLVLDYGWPAASSIVEVLPGLVVVLAIGAVTMWGLWRRRVEGFLGACFLMILAPTSSVVPIVTEVAAEHRMYLPLAAVVCAVVLLAGRLLAHVPAGARRIAGHVATALVVILFTTMTDARNLDYRSDERIWLDTVLKRPDNARARNNYAVDLLLRGENGAAERELRAAVAIDPAMAQAHANLGVALCKQDRCEEGITHFERALAIDPRAPQARRDLGEAYASRGQLGPAVAQYLAALEMQPDEVFLLNRAAWILATAREDAVRDGLHALALAERAVVLTQRNDEESLDTLAAALAEAGQFEQAVRAGTEAIIVAQRRGHTAILPELDVRLAQYRSRQAIRQ